MSTLGTLTAVVDAETKGFVTGMATASAKLESFARDMKRMGREVAQAGLGILAFAGASLKMASEVDHGVKASLGDLKDSVLTLAVQFSRAIAPAVAELSGLLRNLADWFASLSPQVREQVGHWALFGVEAAGVALAISKVAGVVSGLAGMFSTLASAIAGIGLGTLITTIAGVALVLIGVIAAVIAVRKAWHENWNHIQERTAGFVAAVTEGFKSVFKFVVEGVQEMVKIFTDQIRLMVGTAQALLNAVGIHALDGFLETMKTGADWLDFLVTPEGVASLISDAKDLGKNVADYFVEGTADARKWMGDLMSFKGGAAQRFHAPEKQEKGYTPDEGNLAILAGSKELAKLEKEREEWASDLKTWDSAVKESAEAAKAWQEKIEGITAGMAAAGLHLTSKLGDLGQVINSVVQGAQSGGIWGALLALIIEMVSRMKRWKEIMNVANGQLSMLLSDLAGPLDNLITAFKQLMGGIGVLAKALHPIIGFVVNIIARVFRHLTPIFVLVGKILAPLGMFLESIQGIMDIFDKLIPIFKILDVVLSVVGIIILGIVYTIAKSWNFILDVIAGFLDAVGQHGWANEVRKTKMDEKTIEKQIADMAAGIVGGGLAAVADESAAAAENIGAMGDAAKDATEQLLNVPQGYKVALARFESTQTSSGGGMATLVDERRQNYLMTGNPSRKRFGKDK
jgi:phage-related protein